MWLYPRLHSGVRAADDDPTKAKAIRDGIRAGDEEMRLSLFHQQLGAHRADPERVKKADDETADIVNHLRSKWKGTKYEKDFEEAFARQMKDPTYRDKAFSTPPAIKWWKLPDLNINIDWTSPIAVFSVLVVVGFLGLGALMAARGMAAMSEPSSPAPAPPTSDTYGTADYAQPRMDIPGPSYISNGVFFGKSSAPGWENRTLAEAPGAPICSTPANHVLLTARTRTGKGTFCICGTLLRAYLDRSVFVVDPKGENAAVTARARMSFPGSKQKVHIFNPWGALGRTFQDLGFTPAAYNPLDILDKHDPNVVATAQALAAAICPVDKKGKDAYWSQMAGSVLTAVLLWLTVNDRETKTLGRAREIVTKSKKDFQDDFLAPMAAAPDFQGAIREHAAPFIGMAPDTYSGIISNLAQHTLFLSDPRTKDVTSKSTFSMLDLLRRPTSVYLVIPPLQMQTQHTWLRLMLTAALQTYKHHASKQAHRCLFILDELISLGFVNELATDVSIMAGYGVDFLLVVQSISALKDIYGDAAGTIIGNCAYKWFCNIEDLGTAEYLSKVLGNKTVQTKNQSSQQGMSGGQGSTSQSTSWGETARPLLMPDEILHLGRDIAILLAPGDKPHYLRTVDYWALPEAFQNLSSSYPHLYWNPPLTYDENPLPH